MEGVDAIERRRLGTVIREQLAGHAELGTPCRQSDDAAVLQVATARLARQLATVARVG